MLTNLAGIQLYRIYIVFNEELSVKHAEMQIGIWLSDGGKVNDLGLGIGLGLGFQDYVGGS